MLVCKFSDYFGSVFVCCLLANLTKELLVLVVLLIVGFIGHCGWGDSGYALMHMSDFFCALNCLPIVQENKEGDE